MPGIGVSPLSCAGVISSFFERVCIFSSFGCDPVLSHLKKVGCGIPKNSAAAPWCSSFPPLIKCGALSLQASKRVSAKVLLLNLFIGE